MTTVDGFGIFGMLVVGMLLSAFFSGSETGFYRVSRLRLALDGRSGDHLARTLLWLANRPPLFVATTLLGNNLANYMTSLAILLATRAIIGGNIVAEILVPVLVAPLVFVYGELLPKQLYFVAPNKLLRRGAPLFWISFLLFAPFALVLAGLGRLLQFALGESPEEVRWRLARGEINKLLDEGKEIGILRPAQRELAQAVSGIANQTVLKYSLPTHRIPTVSATDSTAAVIQAARRANASEVLVAEQQSEGGGYVRIANMTSDQPDWNQSIQPLARVGSHESPLAAIVQMRAVGSSFAEIVDTTGRKLGVVSMPRLTRQLLG